MSEINLTGKGYFGNYQTCLPKNAGIKRVISREIDTTEAVSAGNKAAVGTLATGNTYAIMRVPAGVVVTDTIVDVKASAGATVTMDLGFSSDSDALLERFDADTVEVTKNDVATMGEVANEEFVVVSFSDNTSTFKGRITIEYFEVSRT